MNTEFEPEAASDGDTGGDTMAARDAGLADFMIAFSLGALETVFVSASNFLM